MEPVVRSGKWKKRQTNVNVKVQEMSHSQRTEWKQYIHAVDWLQQVARYFFYSSKRSETKLSSTVPKVNRKLSHNDSIHFSVWSFLCYWIKTSSLRSGLNLGGGRRPRKAGEKTGNGGNGGNGGRGTGSHFSCSPSTIMPATQVIRLHTLYFCLL